MASRKKSSPPSPLDRYRVPILDRTLDLLEFLAHKPGTATVAALSEALRIPKNSVFRIAATLTLRGYVERDEETKTYRISRKLLGVGYSAVGEARLPVVAAPVLTALRDATGETALLGTLAGAQGVVLDQVASSHPVKVVVEIGHAFPVHTAAPAKAMLAFWSREAQEEFVERMKFPRRTPRTITSVRAFLKELKAVHAQGFALDRGEESETFACVAAPVFDSHGKPVAALWISGPSDRVTPAVYARFGALVKRHAEMLSSKLGYLSKP